MTAGIITFHYGDNFGGVLQSLATQQIVEALGFDAEFVNYVPTPDFGLKVWQGWGQGKGFNWQNIRKRLIRLRHERASIQKFELFRGEHMNRSQLIHSLESFQHICLHYDVLISGSDQIWHLDRSPIYFLDTDSGFKGRKISYASCSGHLEQSADRKAEKRALLCQYDQIAVRNDFTADIVGELAGERPPVVADPTLLADLSEYESDLELPFESYILLYCLGDEIVGSHAAMIQDIRRRVGDLPVVAIVASSHKPQCLQGMDKVFYTADPGDWMTLIKNASMLYTDSYHGVLFALKYGCPVLAYYREAQRSPRMTDLATRYHLQHHIVGGLAEAKQIEGWELPAEPVSMEAIRKHVQLSRKYLKNALLPVSSSSQ